MITIKNNLNERISCVVKMLLALEKLHSGVHNYCVVHNQENPNLADLGGSKHMLHRLSNCDLSKFSGNIGCDRSM